MIVHLNSDAKKAGGRLKELALPIELFETLAEFLKVPKGELIKGEYYADGVLIHTGERD